MPHVPLKYQFDRRQPLDVHLARSERDGLIEVRWPPLDLVAYHEPPQWSDVGPDPRNAERHTPQLTIHGRFGYTLSQFSEFFVIADWYWYDDAIYFVDARIGTSEVTIGEVTPLGRYLFNYHHDIHIHPDWSSLCSVRIWGRPVDFIESQLLHAVILLKKQYNLRFHLFPLLDEEYPEGSLTADRDRVTQIQAPGAVLDIEPLRLFYSGMRQTDHSYAFLQYFRVLEFYSVYRLHGEVDKHRRDPQLGSRDFIKTIAGILRPDDKSAIGQLVALLADSAILDEASKRGLVASPARPATLANALYEFRNSVVHAKYDQIASTTTEPLFQEIPLLEAWRKTCEELAFAALHTFGLRDAT